MRTPSLFAELSSDEELKPAAYHRLAAAIAELAEPKKRVHVLSSYTAQFLEPLLVVEAFRIGLPIEIGSSPFGQLEEEIFNETSQLFRSDNRAALFLVRPEDIEPEIYLAPRGARVDERLEQLASRIAALLAGVRKRSRVPLFVANAAMPASPDAGARPILRQALASYNQRIAEAARQTPDCHVFDWAGVVADFGAAQFSDLRLWYLARIPFSQAAAAFAAKRLARRLASALRPRAKCVVVDLDDTLWGGVLGDDGIGGIQLGGSFPGNVFKEFQVRLKELTREGLLLAIASKNYEAVVREAFEKHPEMVLRWDDFAARRINWNPKAENMREIARELNIGVDSLVFLDNDEVECASVRHAVPEVEAHCLGRDPLKFAAKLASIASLDGAIVTREDEARAQMVADARERSRDEAGAESREAFLASLAMQAQVAACDDVSLARVVQLIGKTNQFNLTTRRYGLDEVRVLVGSADARVLTLRLADKYGDMGLVCVAIVRADGDATWRVDTLLMSCRAMGRAVEDAFLSYICEEVRAAGGTRIIGEYLATPRNEIVKDFYIARGFVTEPGSSEGQKFVLDLNTTGGAQWPDHIARIR
jgi:FkbH-like protein